MSLSSLRLGGLHIRIMVQITSRRPIERNIDPHCLKNKGTSVQNRSNGATPRDISTQKYSVLPLNSQGELSIIMGASLVVQWLRICLPMQGTWVRALVWEAPTCRGATGPVSHNYWACASGACAPQQERLRQWGPRTAMKSGPRSPQLEKALAQKLRPNTAKK